MIQPGSARAAKLHNLSIGVEPFPFSRTILASADVTTTARARIGCDTLIRHDNVEDAIPVQIAQGRRNGRISPSTICNRALEAGCLGVHGERMDNQESSDECEDDPKSYNLRSA